MNEMDVADFTAALNGQDAQDPHSRGARLGEVALRVYWARQPVYSANPAQFERILFLLQMERGKVRQQRLRRFVMVACVMVVGVGMLWRINLFGPQFSRFETEVQLRGLHERPLQHSAQPRASADALLGELAAIGVRGQLREVPGAVWIDAWIGREQEEAVRVLLARHALALPADGRLRVGFVAGEPDKL